MAAILNSAILDSAILHKTLIQTTSIWLKLVHSHSTWWYAAILKSAMLDWDTAILDSNILLSSLRLRLKNIVTPFWLWLKLIQSDSNSFILTQLDDGSHLQFCHPGFSHFAQKELELTQSDSNILWLNLMMAAILNSAMLDWDTAILDSNTLLSSLRFTQKHSPLWTLTQINSIWLKLIHSHLTWWWQPSWILPSWIQPS